MIFIWIACISLFFLVAPRFGNTSGFISMMFPLVTVARFYAYEARPHGIVVGCAALAALAWHRIHTSNRRKWWLLLLFLSLTVASFTHVYGVTLCIPLGMAELLLTIRKRRLDWTVFAVLGAAPLVVIPSLLPLIKSFRENLRGVNFFPPHVSSVAHFYDFLLHPAISVIVLYLAVVLVASLYQRDRSPAARLEPGFLDGIVILALSFTALPVFAVALAVLTKGPFIERYSLSAVMGVALLAGVGLSPFVRQRWVSLSIAVVLSGSVLMDTARLWKTHQAGTGETLIEPSTSLRITTTPGNPLDGHNLLQSAEGPLPILILDGMVYPYLFEYVSESLRQRLWYTDGSDTDVVAHLVRAARDRCNLKYNICTQAEFLKSNRHFLVYSRLNMLSALSQLHNINILSVKSAGVNGFSMTEIVINP
jgi:hypothetical protein